MMVYVGVLLLGVLAGFAVVDSRNILNQNNSFVEHAVLNAKADEVCMKELGCFSITKDFIHAIYRPISVLPNDRVLINTRFLLYSRDHPKESDQLVASNPKTIQQSSFNSKVPTKLIVHGFMDSEVFGDWMVKMKDEFLMHGDYNIIIVDWSGGNKIPYYQATANTRVVGAEIAELIKALEKLTSTKRQDIHIIGHSLGAHIAGYAGERLKTLGRITGCDPAQPYFENMKPIVRLDPTDAEFVDVIHSDAHSKIMFIGFGMNQLVGHVDFFPNNGKKQPGCTKEKFLTFVTDGLKEGLRRFGSCNHQRSLDFMHYSINYRKVVPVGYQCASWENFLDGDCGECGKDTKQCAIMGLRADEYKPFKSNSVQKAYYLQTSGKTPYWLYHYQVLVKLAKPKVAPKDPTGTIDITLFGSKGSELVHIQPKAVKLVHGTQYKYLVTTAKDLGDIDSVSFTWGSSSINPIKLLIKPTLYLEYIVVLPMNVIEKSPRSAAGRGFSGKPTVAIKPKTTTTLLPNKNIKIQ